MNSDHLEQVKSLGDGLSLTVAVGTLVQILPSVAAILTIVWTAIRIYETETVKRLMRRRREKAQAGQEAE